MTICMTVLVKGGPVQVLRRINPLCSYIRNHVPCEEKKVYVAFKPSIISQLDKRTVAEWTRVCNSFYANLGTDLDVYVQFLDQNQVSSETIDLQQFSEDSLSQEDSPRKTDRLYKRVCMGGTFDRLHAGHKILLSTALLRTEECLTVGVTGIELLGKKTLPELIEPLPDRINGVKQFLDIVNRNVEQNVVEIKDPFGPAIVDPTLECIVGSAETEKGCISVNKKRLEAGMSELDVHIIQLVQDTNRQGAYEEEKISSSSGRTRLLGHRLRETRKPWDKTIGPYIIGLTGGSASGKTSIGKKLQLLGAGLVDCDKLGHVAYLPGSPTLQKLVQEFGNQILSEDGTVNRRVLGGIVFSDRSKLDRLNEIVWPEIARMAMDKADQLWKSGCQIVILDAAVLLEAGWDQTCHEIWVCVIPRDEAIQRIVERDCKTSDEAAKRIDSQMSNVDRSKVANTMFCSLWDKEVTQKQVEVAWNRLKVEIGLD